MPVAVVSKVLDAEPTRFRRGTLFSVVFCAWTNDLTYRVTAPPMFAIESVARVRIRMNLSR